MKGISGFLLGVTILLSLLLITFWGGLYLINFQYEKQIGSHIENAYEVNTPDEMIIEVQLAKQGMIDAGLTNNDYGAMWFKKSDNSMAFQYKFLDSILERIQAVNVWYDKVYSVENVNSETMGDVYEQKMDNLREFLKENGRADWIAENAWYVKYHKFGYFAVIISLGWIIVIILMGCLTGVTWDE